MHNRNNKVSRKFVGRCSRPSNISVERKDNESSERLIKRFVRKVKKLKIIEGVKERRYYEKPCEIRARKKRRRASVIKKMNSQSK